MRGPAVVAWEVELDGHIEGEPLVWDERVLVAVDRGGGRRALHTLDLRTGERRAAPYKMSSDRPLVPSLWGRVVAARSGPGRIAALRWGDRKLTPLRSYSCGEEAGPPLLFRDALYLCSDDGLERRRPGASATARGPSPSP